MSNDQRHMVSNHDTWYWTMTHDNEPWHMVSNHDTWYWTMTHGIDPRHMVSNQDTWYRTMTHGIEPWHMVLNHDTWRNTWCRTWQQMCSSRHVCVATWEVCTGAQIAMLEWCNTSFYHWCHAKCSILRICKQLASLPTDLSWTGFFLFNFILGIFTRAFKSCAMEAAVL